MIAQLKDSYPVERICDVLGCPRSSYYYPPSAGADTALVEAIEQLLLRKPYFGYRRIMPNPVWRLVWTLSTHQGC